MNDSFIQKLIENTKKICNIKSYIESQIHKKNTKNDHGGGGSTRTVSLTVKYSLFFWRLP